MICGIDEAGRGPLAGPVCAAAVVLPADFPVYLLDDSKKLSAGLREKLCREIIHGATAWGLGWATHTEIDSVNILQASLLAMKRAFSFMLTDNTAAKGDALYWPNKLEKEFSFGLPFSGFVLPPDLEVVVDGIHTPALPVPCTALVKADSLVPQVMAASILAKTARDTIMEHYGRLYPQYVYERHKGYPTREHRERILKYGPSPVQRMSFKYKMESST
jgi:ribonuclease HII